MSVWRVKQGFKIEETLGSPRYHGNSEKVTCTRVFVGRKSVIMGQIPKIGATMEGIDSTLTIADWDIEPTGGGKANLVIVLEGPPKNTENTSSEPTYEVEWSEVERPLESHPRYANVDKKYMSMVQAYFATTEIAERESIYAQINSDGAKEIIEKRLRGTESYVIYIPIARRGTELTVVNMDGTCGEVGSPGFAVPGGYTYMKSAHRMTKTGRRGKWAKQEEFTGIKYMDTDLYPVQAASPPLT